jgi:hypothetical protein
MGTQNRADINKLTKELPEGLPVDAAWLRERGYTANLLRKYVASGWFEQPAHRVYVRPRGPLAWQQLVVSLQTLLGHDLVVGGRTALELQGYGHYLRRSKPVVYLYGSAPPPTWLANVPLDAKFVHRKDSRLFSKERASTSPHLLSPDPNSKQVRGEGLTTQPWGAWNWPLVISTPERAILEFLDELPDEEDFHQADVLMEGLGTLSPNRLNKLLVDCRSVKVKRLFFLFASRHGHAWLKRLNRKAINLGSGKRMLVKGGRLDPKYQITVPKDFDGVL